jgi:putative phosphoribosyl transferase
MAASHISIPIEGIRLEGELNMPVNAGGLILFAHGSGSSRHSPRNRYVAAMLQRAGLATLLFDLLTEQEEDAEMFSRHLRFDIPFLARRLSSASVWVLDQLVAKQNKAGYFGSSTGAAAALVAAAELRDTIGAVVSRGGRPDLAGESLGRVTAPTLLIVGGHDIPVIPLNEEAFESMNCEKALRTIPGATHLFEEAGALEKVAGMASEWFCNHLQSTARHT